MEEKKRLAFDAYYNQRLASTVKKIELKRQETVMRLRNIRNRTLCLLAVFLITWISALPLFEESGGSLILLFLGVSMIGAFSYLLPYRKEKEELLRQIKEQLIKPSMEFISPSLQYEPENKIAQELFIQANICCKKSIDQYKGEDLIHGKIDDVSIAFSEVEAITISKDKDKDKTTLFKGLFYAIDFHKPFSGAVYIDCKLPVPKWLQGNANNNQERLEDVQMENKQFMERFTVCTTDQTLARFLLTPTFMEQLMQYEQQHPQRVTFAFRNGVMYLAILTHRNYLDVDVYQPLTKQTVVEYLEEIQIAMELMEALQLNVHVWR